MADTAIVGNFVLQRGYFRAENYLARLQNSRNRLLDFRPQFPVLSLNVAKRNSLCAHCGHWPTPFRHEKRIIGRMDPRSESGRPLFQGAPRCAPCTVCRTAEDVNTGSNRVRRLNSAFAPPKNVREPLAASYL